MNIKLLSLIMLPLSTLTLLGSNSSLMDPKDVGAFERIGSDTTKQTTPSIPASGTVHSVQMLDNQSWALKTEDDTWYDPINLPDSLKVEGTHVDFTYREVANWGYTYAGGYLIEITAISRTK